MKKLNQFISLFLVFTLITSSFPANAVRPLPGVEEGGVNQSLPRVEEIEPTPQNPPGTAPGVTCSLFDQKPNLLTGGVCCVGLELNALGKCDERAFNDVALVGCISAASCTGGTGCFPQSAPDLFSSLSPSTVEEQLLSEQKQELEAQLDETPTLKPVGAVCIHARDCVSYSCRSGICEDKKVCRFAGAGEIALGGVNCGKDLIKKSNGMCEVDPATINPVYPGLLTDIKVEELGKCEFRLDDMAKQQSIVAMQSLRAMEFFLSTISEHAQKECFDVMPLLKNDIGVNYLDTRKNILTNFTDVLNQIEFDFKQVMDASKKYGYHKTAEPIDLTPKQLTMHGSWNTEFSSTDESISDKDLATRQTSGYDNLMLMYRRNLLFQSYEKNMLDAVKTSLVKVSGLSQGMQSWSDEATSWNMGTKTVAAYNCEGSRYTRKRVFGKWKSNYYDRVKDRWLVHYEVTGSAEANASIVRRDGVAEVLKLIGAKATKEDAIAEFTKSKYYLMDPLLFSGMPYQGQDKPLKSSSSFLGLFGGFRDLRKAYYIKGDSVGSYQKMHTDLKPKLTAFYKALKINQGQKGFVYEPELLSTEAKDCLDNPADPSKCEKFQPFLDRVLDETFAHFLAYSYYNKTSYEGFFTHATTYRRKLLGKLETDMKNITAYYEKILKHRDTQNECIEKVINGLADSEILESDNDGLTEGGTYYDPAKGGKPSAVPGSRTANNAIRKLTPKSRNKFMFNLAGSSLRNGTGTSMMDSVVSSDSSSSRAGVDASQSAFLAARKDAMLKANAKASALGINVAAKEKAVRDSMKKLASRSGSGGAGGLGATGIRGDSAFVFGDGTGKASVSGDTASKNEVSGEANSAATSADSTGNGVKASSGVSWNESGVYGGSSANPGFNAYGTGLSDADMDRLKSEYERNKKEYEGSEEDGIFSKVSKAYVRNLDKVLTKKKKIEP